MCLVVTFCALVGLWLRGFWGFFIGGAVGFALGSLLQTMVRTKLHQVQALFVDATFAVMGALCKADGVVTRDEIQVVQQIFGRLHLSPEQTEEAKAAFERGKAPDFDLEAAVGRFAQAAPRGSSLRTLFLQLQMLAVAADGQVHAAEHAMLVRVARGLGFSEGDVARLEALLRAAAAGPTSVAGPPARERLDDAYAALGVSAEASDAEVKRAYRRMISENHPDRIAARGLPEAMRELADERAREINAAYDLIKRARQLG